MKNFEEDGHFRFQDQRSEVNAKIEEYEQAILEERKSKGQQAAEILIEEADEDEGGDRVAMQPEETEHEKKKRLFSIADDDEGTKQSRIDEFVISMSSLLYGTK